MRPGSPQDGLFDIKEALSRGLLQYRQKPIVSERFTFGAKSLRQTIGIDEQTITRVQLKFFLLIRRVREHPEG